MIKKPVIGISGCLGGSAVRFDGGHKRDDFLMDKLVEWVTFRPVCPEMAIGLPVPRPALRLVRSKQGNIRMCFSHDQNEGNDSNLLIVFYVQIMPDDFVMQLHRF